MNHRLYSLFNMDGKFVPIITCRVYLVWMVSLNDHRLYSLSSINGKFVRVSACIVYLVWMVRLYESLPV